MENNKSILTEIDKWIRRLRSDMPARKEEFGSETDDIVTRLRTVDEFSDAIGIMDEAAAEIESLRSEIERLSESLDNFARLLAIAKRDRDAWRADAHGG